MKETLLEIIKRNPGITGARITAIIEQRKVAEWKAKGGLWAWAAKHPILVVFGTEWIYTELYKLENEGLVKHEKSSAAYWGKHTKEWLHRYHYYATGTDK